MSTTGPANPARRLTALLLAGGVFGPLVYIGTDVLGALRYPGYSFTRQAPSELFALGSPTSQLVVPLFSLSSLLLVGFGLGVWRASAGKRALRVLALLVVANGVDSLLLWALFPMHMRGATPTFTDTMHLVLAVNPFVLLSIVVGLAAFRDWFRLYSLATVVVLIVFATIAFSYVPATVSRRPTPYLGLSERSSQYAHLVWHAVLAIVLLRRARLPRAA